MRLPSLAGRELWARLVGVGGGSNRGIFWSPQPGDEVLVAFRMAAPHDAFVLGGLWNGNDRPPVADPTEALDKRVIRSGIGTAPGHEIVLDDTSHSISITTSTRQRVTIGPEGIELANGAGTMRITMDHTTQSITLEAMQSIELKTEGRIRLNGTVVEISGTATTSIRGGLVTIN